MKVNGKTLAAIVVALIIGALLGAWYGKSHHEIVVDVEEGTNRLNLSPEPKDKIRWVNQSDGKPVDVQFSTGAPCEEIKNPGDTTSICTINVPDGNYQYKCKNAICEDPGIDPRNNKLVAAAPPSEKPVTATSTSEIASISCVNGAPTVTWDPDPPGSALHPDETVVWKGGSLQFTVAGFNIGGTPVQVCSQATINQGHRVCTVVQDAQHNPPYSVAYTVSTSGDGSCGSAPFSLTVNPPPQ